MLLIFSRLGLPDYAVRPLQDHHAAHPSRFIYTGMPGAEEISEMAVISPVKYCSVLWKFTGVGRLEGRAAGTG